tara:strand:+ start:435 stop:644 length:210 start_codon:yes stop_codon:yes gene_type:complete
MIRSGKRLQVSEREGREMRLFWLLGLSGAEMARRMGRQARTVNAVIRERNLDGPERPFEMARLALRAGA